MMSDQEHLSFSSLLIDNKVIASPSWKLFDFQLGNLTPDIPARWDDQRTPRFDNHESPSMTSNSSSAICHDQLCSEEMANQIPDTQTSSARSREAASLPSLEKERFRSFHEDKWWMRYRELVQYKRTHGDCLVPHSYKCNPQLGRWVKRQRRQYKILNEGKNSTMTPDRVQLLEEVGFVWDSHEAVFQERVVELAEYRKNYGSAIISSRDTKHKQLYTWVKGMRRQYKLYWLGKSTSMTPRRISQLEKVGFEWEVRPSNRGKEHVDRPDLPLSFVFDNISTL